MRIALLSTIDDLPRPGQLRAAFAQFAGARVVERQLDLALAMECETIACLVDAVGREVIELQHRAERAGARFVALRDPRPLGGIVTAADELLVLATAVLPDEAAVGRHLTKPAVLVFPADPGVALGYERIDAEFAWSGVMLARGAIVEQLLELPPDTDAPSALMRIALQSGTRIHPLEKRLLDEGAWHLRAESEALAEREARWIRGHAQLAPFSAPGLAVSERMGARLAQDLLGTAGARMPWFASAGAGGIALTLAAFGMSAIGLGFGALMAMFAAMGLAIERIGQAGQLKARRSLVARAIAWLTDPILIALLGLSAPEATGWLRWFVPIMLFGLLHLGERFAAPRWRASYADRVLLGFVLAPLAFFGFAQPIAALLSLLVLISLFFAREPGD